ncbi:hypothetical protein [Priestia koreensis]|nr:hypothetical protein [Priestia koreensis]
MMKKNHPSQKEKTKNLFQEEFGSEMGDFNAHQAYQPEAESQAKKRCKK